MRRRRNSSTPIGRSSAFSGASRAPRPRCPAAPANFGEKVDRVRCRFTRPAVGWRCNLPYARNAADAASCERATRPSPRRRRRVLLSLLSPAVRTRRGVVDSGPPAPRAPFRSAAAAGAAGVRGPPPASWGSVVPKVESKRRIVEKPRGVEHVHDAPDRRRGATLCVSGWTQRGTVLDVALRGNLLRRRQIARRAVEVRAGTTAARIGHDPTIINNGRRVAQLSRVDQGQGRVRNSRNFASPKRGDDAMIESIQHERAVKFWTQSHTKVSSRVKELV